MGERIWMLPREWEEWHSCVRGTHQYIIMRIKLYFTFEGIEDAIMLTFNELMNFP